MTAAVERLAQALADRYVIKRELGSGGMATVYLAEDLKHNRNVAVKVLRPELAAVLGPDRFLREIETVAQLNHPHILSLYDSGTADGFLYYVMPVVEGQSLRERLDHEGPLPIDDALRFTEDVASALHYAHRHGVLHRDIKPENILLHEGEAVVTDFGIALAVREAGGQRLTETGFSLGTPEYMSPEQAAGERAIDARSDIYSLGCVLYEMLTAEPPFLGATVQSVIAKRLSEPPPDVTKLRNTTPRRVGNAVTRALANAPADRYSTALEFANALQGTHSLADQVRSVRLRWIVPAAAMIMLAIGIVLFARSFGGSNPVNAAEQRILVLPFSVLGAADDLDIGEALAVEIMSRLGSIVGLNPLGRQTALEARDRELTVNEIYNQFGARYLLDGTVQIQRNEGQPARVRVVSALSSTTDGSQLWTRDFNGEMDDLFAVQSRIAQQVIDALGIVLGESDQQALTAMDTENPDAFEHYVRGEVRYQAVFPGWGPEMEVALREFQDAAADDPQFAKAHARLAAAHVILWRGDRSPDRLDLAKATADQALALDPNLPEALSALGMYYFFCCRNYDSAFKYIVPAVEQRPSDFTGQAILGALYKRTGQWERAAIIFRSAAETDPMARSPTVEATTAYRNLRAWNEAERFGDRHIALRPLEPDAYNRKAIVQLSSSGDIEAAERTIEQGANRLDMQYFEWVGRLATYRFYAFAPLFRILCTPEVCDEALQLSLEEQRVDITPELWSLHNRYEAISKQYGQVGDDEMQRVYADSAINVTLQLLDQRPSEEAHFRIDLAFYNAILGREADVIAHAERAVSLVPIEIDHWEHSLTLIGAAEAYAMAQLTSPAIEALRSLLAMPSGISVELLLVDPIWAPLRSSTEFQTLVSEFQR